MADEIRVEVSSGSLYLLAPGQDPDADVVTLVGYRGEPGKAIPRKEWLKMKLLQGAPDAK